MVKKGSLFIIGSDGSYLQAQRGVLRAQDNYTSVIQVLAPFDIGTVVEVNYLIYGANNETITQYVSSTAYTGADMLDSSHSLYQDVQDWVLWEIEVTSRTLTKISKYKASQLGISFSFKERYAPASAVTYVDTFGLDGDLPASSTTGYYYICDAYNYVSANAGLTFTKNDYAVWNGTAWTKPTQYTLTQNTTTIGLAVSGSMASVVATELTSDEEFELLFTDVQSDVNAIIAGTQVVGEATKATNDGNDNEIFTTYEKITDNDAKLALKVDKTFTILGIDMQDNIQLEEFKTAIGIATSTLSGLMSSDDRDTLTALVALLDVEDPDSLVNTINEIVAVFVGYPEGTTMIQSLALKADQATTYTKTEVNNLVTSIYRYKGSVNAYSNLPDTGQVIGDVWNVIADETTDDTYVNYAWVGISATFLDGWDNIGGVEALATAANDGLLSKEDYAELQTLKSRVDQSLTTTADVTHNSTTVKSIVIKDIDGTAEQATVTYKHTNGNNYQVVQIEYPDGRIVQIGEEMYNNFRNGEISAVLNGYTLMTDGVSLGNQASNGLLFDEDSIYSRNFLGVVTTTTVAQNAKSKATFLGIVSGIPLANLYVSGTAYAEGDVLFAREGKLSNVAPTKPARQIRVGVVINVVSTVYDVLVIPQIYDELNELSDVVVTSIQAGDILKRDATNNFYENVNLDNALNPLENVIEMVYVSAGQFKTTVDDFTLTDGKKLTLLFPNTLTDLTTAVTVSFDDGVTYKALKYSDTSNDVVVKHTQDLKTEVYYDNVEWFMTGEPLLNQTETYDSIANSTKDSLKPIKGLAEFVDFDGLSLNQEVSNGNFANGTTEWTGSFSTLSESGEILSITGDGTNTQPRAISSFSSINGIDYLLKVRVRVTNSDCNSLRYALDTGSASIQENPVINQWYEYSTIINSTGIGSLTLYHRYVDNATASGKIMEVDYAMAIPITNTPLASKTASELDNIIPTYIEGVVSITNPEIQSTGVNLLDKSLFEQGSIDASGVDVVDPARLRTINLLPSKPSTTYVGSAFTDYAVRQLYWYDIDENFLYRDTGGDNITWTSPSNGYYFRLIVRKISGDIVLEDVDVANFQLQEGSTATAYQEYNSDIFKLTNLDGSDLPMLSVGTSVRDKAYKYNGKYYKDQYVSTYTLTEDDVEAITTGTNAQWIRVLMPTNYADYATTNPNDISNLELEGFSTTVPSFVAADNADLIGTIVTSITGKINVIVAIGTYADLATAKTALAGKTVTFELADIVTTEIEAQGTIVQEATTTLVQLNNFASEYDVTFSCNARAQLELLSSKVKSMQTELDENNRVGWVDLLGEPKIFATGSNDPTFSTYIGNLRQFKLSTTLMNELFFEYHIPHEYVEGTDMFIHTHWSTIVGDTDNVKWNYEISYSKGYNQEPFSTPITASVIQAGSATAFTHQIAEVQFTDDGTSLIDRDRLQTDGIILVRLYRDPTDGSDTLTQAPFVHYSDIHLQAKKLVTANKNYPFE